MGQGAAGTQAARVASTISPIVSTDSSRSGLFPRTSGQSQGQKNQYHHNQHGSIFHEAISSTKLNSCHPNSLIYPLEVLGDYNQS